MWVRGLFGGVMSDPAPTTHGFNVGNDRRVRPRIAAATMTTAIVILAYVALYGNAIAAAEYAVDGLAVGTQLNFTSASYREFKCTPSEQFDGLTWCQKTRTEIGRRGPYAAGYSILHSGEGNVFYVNRSQDASFFNQAEVQADISRYSRSIGQSPQIMKMPHRNGLPDGIIA